ncbi:carbapenem antibiotics biosynthesis protein card [Plectosphaerella plurivora]|uniref:Proline dehydrogenase n=1 Tax=Plectosphaerella plurivora TaxID=936078 RepID=A0A9P9AE01_9PEZI|nr:carbapenem antibiotics biosynthesis protein card [Plectosphaerella plurivora]
MAPSEHSALSDVAAKKAMARIPTKNLLRSLALTELMTQGWLLRPSIAFMGLIAGSRSAFLNPDKNPILNRLLRWTVYNHFCAGTNPREVRQSIAEHKQMGYQGVILNHAKEILLEHDDAKSAAPGADYSPAYYAMIAKWREYALNGLAMLQPGDFLSLKLTGAGPIIIHALQAKGPIPAAMDEALTAICEAAKKQGSRVWFDAEQTGLQPGVDEWALEMMRRWNRDGQALVYNTIQAYLKGSTENANRHITLAAEQGWTVAIKLVRGAYIEQEPRAMIHDTKEDTDRCYDAIADSLLSRRLPAEAAARGLEPPAAALFLATHNAPSTTLACETHRARLVAGLPTCALECGQLVGMADELGCELIENYEREVADATVARGSVPRAFKYLTWGTVGECMGYLHRRAIENSGAVEASKHMVASLRAELWRRMFG